MRFNDFIIQDPGICGGEPVIKGTRVTLRTVLASLADGDTRDEIRRDFPTVTDDALQAVIAFAASSAQDDIPVPGVPSV